MNQGSTMQQEGLQAQTHAYTPMHLSQMRASSGMQMLNESYSLIDDAY